jgi:hypothetical protein
MTVYGFLQTCSTRVPNSFVSLKTRLCKNLTAWASARIGCIGSKSNFLFLCVSLIISNICSTQASITHWSAPAELRTSLSKTRDGASAKKGIAWVHQSISDSLDSLRPAFLELLLTANQREHTAEDRGDKSYSIDSLRSTHQSQVYLTGNEQFAK